MPSREVDFHDVLYNKSSKVVQSSKNNVIRMGISTQSVTTRENLIHLFPKFKEKYVSEGGIVVGPQEAQEGKYLGVVDPNQVGRVKGFVNHLQKKGEISDGVSIDFFETVTSEGEKFDTKIYDFLSRAKFYVLGK